MSNLHPRAVVIGASTGGVHALRALLAGLDADLPASVLIVQHMAHQDSPLIDVLAEVCALPLKSANAREAVREGEVYVAPPGYHLLVEVGADQDIRTALNIDPKVCFSRPSVDVLFESAADVWGAGLIAVVLTGANEDGAKGLQAVRRRRGIGIVQDPRDAEMPEMPRQALQLAGADHILPLEQIAAQIKQILSTDIAPNHLGTP